MSVNINAATDTPDVSESLTVPSHNQGSISTESGITHETSTSVIGDSGFRHAGGVESIHLSAGENVDRNAMSTNINSGINKVIHLNDPSFNDQEEAETASETVMLDTRFSCNICLDPVTEPVVTRCGHLYCWPCLYRWLKPGINRSEHLRLLGNGDSNDFHTGADREVIQRARRCPVCNSECTVSTIVPIYVRTDPPSCLKKNTSVAEGVNTSCCGSSENFENPEHGEPNQHDENLDVSGLDNYESMPTESDGFGSPNSSDVGLRRRRINQDISETDADAEISPTSFTLMAENSVPSRPLPPSVISSVPTRNIQSQEAQQHQNLDVTNSTSRPFYGIMPVPTGNTQSLFQALLGLQLQPSHPQHNRSSPAMSAIPPIHTTGGNNTNRSELNTRFSRNVGGDETTISEPNGPGEEDNGGEVQSLYLPNEVTRDDTAAEFLSRLLLMLGSFVILCLLLF